MKLAILDRFDSKRSSCSEDHFLTSSSWNLRSGLGQAADDFPVCLGPAEVTKELERNMRGIEGRKNKNVRWWLHRQFGNFDCSSLGHESHVRLNLAIDINIENIDPFIGQCGRGLHHTGRFIAGASVIGMAQQSNPGHASQVVMSQLPGLCGDRRNVINLGLGD